MAQLLEVAAQPVAELIDDDVTVAQQLNVEVEVLQLLAVDQYLRHFMRDGACRHKTTKWHLSLKHSFSTSCKMGLAARK